MNRDMLPGDEKPSLAATGMSLAFWIDAETDPTREVAGFAGSLCVAVERPATGRGAWSAHLENPPSGGFAMASAAAALEMEDGAVVSSRIVLGGVAHAPHRTTGAEDTLAGAALEAAALDRVAGCEHGGGPQRRAAAVDLRADAAMALGAAVSAMAA